MIFGTVEIKHGALHTSNDSYALLAGTTFSVLRPFRATGITISLLLCAFGISFFDLLYAVELLAIATCATLSFLTGNIVAHLVIANRELRGSDLSVALWGTYRHLNIIRRELADTVNNANTKYDQEKRT